MMTSPRLARLLLVQPTLEAAQSLIPLFDDPQLEAVYELSTSHQHATRKLFRSPAPYQVVVCNTQLADIQNFLLLTHNRTVHPSVPFIVTATTTAEHGSARRALHEGALDVIPAPLDQEQAVKSIRRALWHNWLRRLIAQRDVATAKYREHLAAYPHDQRLDDAFRRTCGQVETSLALLERNRVWMEEIGSSLSDIATGLETQTRTQALIRLNASSLATPPPTTILLIDDNDKDRTYYAERIRIGYPDCTVLEARDGRSGLALYRSREIDCIITELDLPDMSGYDLLTEVVPHASKPAIAVVILTHAVLQSLNNLAMQNGAQAFFVKRFTSGDELVPRIQKAIARVGPTRKDRHKDDQISG